MVLSFFLANPFMKPQRTQSKRFPDFTVGEFKFASGLRASGICSRAG